MADSNGYTPTHRRILKLLEDGEQHHRDEVFSCLYDELSDRRTLWFHMSGLRSILKKNGKDVAVINISGVVLYQLVDTPTGFTTV